jgi:hypothetical protein
MLSFSIAVLIGLNEFHTWISNTFPVPNIVMKAQRSIGMRAKGTHNSPSSAINLITDI